MDKPTGVHSLQLGGHRWGEPTGWAIVDPIDFARFGRFKWSFLRGYATARLPGYEKPVLLHRMIMGLEVGDRRQVDHINRDKLDNRRANLRVLLPAQNAQNVPGRPGTSRHRGVSWSAPRGKWVAQAQLNGRQNNLGRYQTEAEAVAAVARFHAARMPYARA